MVRCVLRISSVGLASAPDLPGVNLDADSEEFDLLDMPLLGDLPLSVALSISVVRGEDLLEKHQL